MSQNTSEIDDKKKDTDFCQYLLILLDGQFKKVSVDAYALQMANTRNYLWIFFVILSFAAAFFKEAELGSVFLKLFTGDSFSIPCVFLFFSFLGTVVISVIGFWVGINSVSGTDLPFPYQDLPERLANLEANGSTALEQWALTRALIDRTYIALFHSYEILEKRGKLLRNLSKIVKGSVICILLTILFYGISNLE